MEKEKMKAVLEAVLFTMGESVDCPGPGRPGQRGKGTAFGNEGRIR